MTKRIHKVANFLAFNLLFFALYLNFIYTDQGNTAPIPQKTQENVSAFGGPVSETKTQTSQHITTPKPAALVQGELK